MKGVDFLVYMKGVVFFLSHQPNLPQTPLPVLNDSSFKAVSECVISCFSPFDQHLSHYTEMGYFSIENAKIYKSKQLCAGNHIYVCLYSFLTFSYLKQYIYSTV